MPNEISQKPFEFYKKQIEEFFYIALWHFLDHRCGAAFFKFPEKLFNLVQKEYAKNILEIGTGIGYSAFIMNLACQNSKIDTIEMEEEHFLLAKKYLEKYENINLIKDEALNIIPKLENNFYDVIFYDGYAPQISLVKDFVRILKRGGILISANINKKGIPKRDGAETKDYINYLNNFFVKEEIFEDIIVTRKI
jgi:predicted O-methyltransferase YrrM